MEYTSYLLICIVVTRRSKRFGGQIFQQKPLRPFITFAQPLMEEFAVTQLLSVGVWVQFYVQKNVQDFFANHCHFLCSCFRRVHLIDDGMGQYRDLFSS